MEASVICMGEEIDDSSKLGFFLSPPFDGKICRKVFVHEKKRKESSSPVNMDLCCFYHHQQQCDIANAAKLIRMKQRNWVRSNFPNNYLIEMCLVSCQTTIMFDDFLFEWYSEEKV